MSSKKSISEPATERSASQSKEKKVELDLPEILEGELRKEAEDECRTLEQHILYILKNRSRVLRELVYRGNRCPSYTWEIESIGGGRSGVTSETC